MKMATCRNIVCTMSAVVMTILAGKAAAVLGSCAKEYSQTCCDWQAAHGGITVFTCNASNNGAICGWIAITPNPTLWFVRSPVGDEKGHTGVKPSATGNCNYMIQVCKSGVCQPDFLATAALFCNSTAVEDKDTALCP